MMTSRYLGELEEVLLLLLAIVDKPVLELGIRQIVECLVGGWSQIKQSND